MAEAKFLAFDLGAESGRGVVGCFDGARLRLEDVHRFPNGAVRLLDTLHWDALRLFAELKRGLGMAVAAHGKEFAGIGIDTWAWTSDCSVAATYCSETRATTAITPTMP